MLLRPETEIGTKYRYRRRIEVKPRRRVYLIPSVLVFSGNYSGSSTMTQRQALELLPRLQAIPQQAYTNSIWPSRNIRIQSTLDTSIPDVRIYWLQAYLQRSHIVNKHISDTRIFLFFLLSHHTYACS